MSYNPLPGCWCHVLMLSAEQPWVTAALVSSLSGSADAGACLASRVWDAAPGGGMRLFSGSESTVCLCKTPSEDRRFPSPVPSSCTACGVVIQAVFPGARCGSVCGVTSWQILHVPSASSSCCCIQSWIRLSWSLWVPAKGKPCGGACWAALQCVGLTSSLSSSIPSKATP